MTAPMHSETWRIGDVTVTKIVEVTARLAASDFFPNLDPSRLHRAGWLKQYYLDDRGFIVTSVHSFLVQTPTARILVDTCNGNDKPRSYESMSMLDTPYLERLTAAGAAPESMDQVVCTHLHFDHVGWNTQLVDGEWTATFPTARYIFSRGEWEFWRAHPHAQDEFDSAAVLADSVWPLKQAVVDLVDDGDTIAEHVRVSAFPGHTPGHLCVWLESQGEQAVITGDVMHSPLQFVDPTWHGRADVVLDESTAARHRFIEQVADTDTLVLGTHFPTPSGGLVRSDGDGWTFQPVAPAAQGAEGRP